MECKFKDYFSQNSEEYGRFRPKYPPELFSYLSSVSSGHQKAWDCATGTGQSAVALSAYFSDVIATDASETQIGSAEKKENITYQVATAENSNIDANSIDLITVAQAFHWFDVDGFYNEANRVLKDRGIVAIWSYNLLSVQNDIDDCIDHLYSKTLGSYWPKERKMVEDGYKCIELSFYEMAPPNFDMSAKWNLGQLMGYLCTWSASKEYEKKHGVNPVEEIYDEIEKMWGNPEKEKPIKWPLSTRIWQKNT